MAVLSLLVISGWGNPMVWLFEGGVAEGECVAHGCFDGYAEQVAESGGRRRRWRGYYCG